ARCCCPAVRRRRHPPHRPGGGAGRPRRRGGRRGAAGAAARLAPALVLLARGRPAAGRPLPAGDAGPARARLDLRARQRLRQGAAGDRPAAAARRAGAAPGRPGRPRLGRLDRLPGLPARARAVPRLPGAGHPAAVPAAERRQGAAGLAAGLPGAAQHPAARRGAAPLDPVGRGRRRPGRQRPAGRRGAHLRRGDAGPGPGPGDRPALPHLPAVGELADRPLRGRAADRADPARQRRAGPHLQPGTAGRLAVARRRHDRRAARRRRPLRPGGGARGGRGAGAHAVRL
ncbi:MAG: hypothetical protein AVDCRST_MAG35-1041, partial [uncultured Quadrisphaera sp.]